MARRRGIIPVVAAAMSAVALIVGIAIIVGVVNALGQVFMGQVSGSFGGFNFGGSYETTSVLDGLVIETSGKTAIEDHLALSAGATDPTGHFTATNIDQNLGNNPAALRKAKTMFNGLLRRGLTSSFIANLNGVVPPEDEAWYIVQRWCYSSQCFKGAAVGTKVEYLRKRVVVTNPATGKSVVTSVLDWGPAAYTGRVSGLSPEAAFSIGADTGTNLQYGWAVDQSVPLGPVINPSSQYGGGSTTTSNVGDGLQKTSRGFPRFMQYKGPWASQNYGSPCLPRATVSSAGCGPSSLANVALYYQEAKGLQFTALYTQEFGNAVNPGTISTLSKRTGGRPCGGTAYSMFNTVGRRYLNLRSDAASWSAVVNALRQKIPVISTMGPGYFTSTGHFITLYDISSNGKTIYVSDSYKRNRTEAPASTVKDQAKGFYIITPTK
jgi:hypothetical protein